MILCLEIEPKGDLSPVMVAHRIGEDIGLPYQVISMGCDDEAVQLEIELDSTTAIVDGVINNPFNQEAQ